MAWELGVGAWELDRSGHSFDHERFDDVPDFDVVEPLEADGDEDALRLVAEHVAGPELRGAVLLAPIDPFEPRLEAQLGMSAVDQGAADGLLAGILP